MSKIIIFFLLAKFIGFIMNNKNKHNKKQARKFNPSSIKLPKKIEVKPISEPVMHEIEDIKEDEIPIVAHEKEVLVDKDSKEKRKENYTYEKEYDYNAKRTKSHKKLIDKNNIKNAIVWNEILNKPKSMR